MALSEIEKLERRYAENPQGLTFAPLAEVHRKNGDVARALELLQPGLTLHPDYIPASIVLGRCHLDLGDLPAAETAFGHVLGLDGENVIALKALADISERQSRFDEAERWLRTLLAIDRSNDDARDQLGRVEAARRQTESAAGTAASSDVAPAEAPLAAASAEDGAVESLLDEEPVSIGSESVEAASAEAPPAVSSPPVPETPRDPVLAWTGEADGAEADEAAPLDLEDLDTSVDFDGPRPEGIQLEQPVTLEDPVQPLPGLVGRETSAHEGGSFDEGDFRVEMAEDIVLNSSGGSEFQMANAAEELLATRGAPEAEPPQRRPPAEVEPAAAAADEAEPGNAEPAMAEPVAAEPVTPVAETPVPWAAPVAEPPREPEPDLVVTESMAELLLQQGHPVEALTVYRHLASRAGSEPRFQEKIANLERVTAAPAPAYSVLVTHGQSVQAFLRGVLAARPPVVAGGSSVHSAPPRSGAAEPEGAPTRPAHDSLSLSSVFGEESTPTMPAVPAAGTSGPAQGGVSYDEFFGASGASSAPRPPRATDPKGDDLDQFHAWLQNLKR
jgi:tetratricopeptide (TPR) repeat protein